MIKSLQILRASQFTIPVLTPAFFAFSDLARQIYILARYLEYYGPRVWVNGYAILLHGNCPVDSEYVLSSIEDIDRVIHTPGRTRLNKETISKIAELLQ